MTDVFVTIIIPAAEVEAARELAATIPGGQGMFTAALSPTGSAPATHYISSGHIFQEFADLLPLTTVEYEQEDSAETTRPGDVETVEAIALQAGFTLPLGTIAALFDAIDVTELGPWAAMARLGLVMVMVQAEAVE